jgi:hypothetical protein
MTHFGEICQKLSTFVYIRWTKRVIFIIFTVFKHYGINHVLKNIKINWVTVEPIPRPLIRIEKAGGNLIRLSVQNHQQ